MDLSKMDATKIWAIMQPNLFPWLGYFDRIWRSDAYIFFDHVQRPRGKNWVQRVKVMCGPEAKWLTIPIQKSGHSVERLSEARISEPGPSQAQLLEKLHNWYKGAPKFDETMEFMRSFENTETSLARYNADFIAKTSAALDLDNEFYFSSEKEILMNSELRETDMILATAEQFEVGRYLSGSGCLDFLEVDRFAEENIQISLQYYPAPSYPQFGQSEFVPGLSIIDALMNLGFDGTEKLIKETPLSHQQFE